MLSNAKIVFKQQFEKQMIWAGWKTVETSAMLHFLKSQFTSVQYEKWLAI